jgi:glycerol-3-phosphate acyltransferase PlsX
VKSHGGANAIGIANALKLAAKLVDDDLTRRIGEDLGNIEARAA